MSLVADSPALETDAPLATNGPECEPAGVWTSRQAWIGVGVLAVWRVVSYFGSDAIGDLPDLAWCAVSIFLPLGWMLFYPLVAARWNDRSVTLLPEKETRAGWEVGYGLLAGVGLTVGLFGVSFAYYWLTGEQLGNSMETAQGDSFRVTVLALVAFTLTPVAEELFFRGLLFDAWRREHGWSNGLLLQAAVFAVMHDWSPPQLVVRFLLGLGLGGLALARRSLIAPMASHAVLNFVWSAAVAMLLLVTAHAAFLGVGGEPADEGIRITAIVPGSPAEEAGLLPGDLLRTIDGTPIRDKDELTHTIRGKKPGQVVKLELLRDAKPLTVEATLLKRKEIREQP